MAKFKPYQCLEDQLSFLPIEEGQLIFTTDTKKIYLDMNNVRTLYGGSVNMEDIGVKVLVDFDVNPLG